MSALRTRFGRALGAFPVGEHFLGLLRKRHALKLHLFGRRLLTPGSAARECELVAETKGEPTTIDVPLADGIPLAGGVAGMAAPGDCHRALPNRLLRIPGAHLLEEPGAVLGSRRRIAAENLHGPRRALLGFSPVALTLRSFGPASDRLGSVFVLLGPYSYNYFHWLNDHLPRVEHYIDRLASEPDLKLLVPRWLTPWQRRSLELLGVGEGRLVRLTGSHGRARVAYLASHPGFEVDGLPAAPARAAWVRERILAAVAPGRPARGARLFVSRRDALGRQRIANEDELGARLAGRGFETVVLSELDFDEQVRRFAAASVVVAAHGAGLANLLFSEAPSVVELVPEGEFRPDYLVLTSYVGGRHRAVAAAATSAGRYRADPRDVEAAIEELGC